MINLLLIFLNIYKLNSIMNMDLMIDILLLVSTHMKFCNSLNQVAEQLMIVHEEYLHGNH